MQFDASKPFTDDEYKNFVAWLTERTTLALRRSREEGLSPESAIIAYLETAYASGFSISEADDYFGISTPNIAEQAGYTGESFAYICKVFDDINKNVASQFFK